MVSNKISIQKDQILEGMEVVDQQNPERHVKSKLIRDDIIERHDKGGNIQQKNNSNMQLENMESQRKSSKQLRFPVYIQLVPNTQAPHI